MTPHMSCFYDLWIIILQNHPWLHYIILVCFGSRRKGRRFRLYRDESMVMCVRVWLDCWMEETTSFTILPRLILSFLKTFLQNHESIGKTGVKRHLMSWYLFGEEEAERTGSINNSEGVTLSTKHRIASTKNLSSPSLAIHWHETKNKLFRSGWCAVCEFHMYKITQGLCVDCRRRSTFQCKILQWTTSSLYENLDKW